MSDNVIEFNSKLQRGRKDLEERKSELQDLHNRLNEAYELMGKMEEHIETVETAYNESLVSFCNEHGIDEVTIDDFSWATSITVTSTPSGTITFSLPGFESEIEFTPEED